MTTQNLLFGLSQPSNARPAIEDRIEEQRREREAILNRYEEKEKHERLRRARDIAVELAMKNGTVTVASVHDVFVERYGEKHWRDANGKSYWAGAIFRGKDWQREGSTESPLNHNPHNGVWRWIGGAQ